MSRNRRSPGFKDSRSPSNHNEITQRHKNDRSNPRGIRSLCLSNIPQNISDASLCKSVNKEFSRFGEFQVSITNYNGERVAYLNFMRPHEAQNALDRMQNFEIDDRRLNIRAIYISGLRWSPGRRSRSPPIIRNRRQSSEKPSRSVSPRSTLVGHKDNVPTRTLFVGNLPNDIELDYLHRKFDKYGQVIHIDIKRQSNIRNAIAYAFVRYATLEMATRAKHELDGEVTDGLAMKIGYGKPTPSKCIWIGGLGPWLTFEDLERDVVRLGSVSIIEWPRNKSHAYVIFHSINDAMAAIDTMRSMTFGERRITADYTDLSYFQDECDRQRRRRQVSPSSQGGTQSQSAGPALSSLPPPQSRHVTLDNARNTAQLADCLRRLWAGKIIVKKNKFGCRLYRVRGDESLVDEYLYEERHKSFQHSSLSLHVTHTMTMDRGVLSELRQRMDSLRGKYYCVLLATSYVLTTTLIDDALSPPQPIKTLVDYLRARNSTGVIILPPGNNTGPTKKTSGGGSPSPSSTMLHIVPPCDFVFDLLRDKAPSLSHKAMMDDFLLVIMLQHIEL